MDEQSASQALKAELGIDLEYTSGMWAAFWKSTIKSPSSYSKLFIVLSVRREWEKSGSGNFLKIFNFLFSIVHSANIYRHTHKNFFPDWRIISWKPFLCPIIYDLYPSKIFVQHLANNNRHFHSWEEICLTSFSWKLTTGKAGCSTLEWASCYVMFPVLHATCLHCKLWNNITSARFLVGFMVREDTLLL